LKTATVTEALVYCVPY